VIILSRPNDGRSNNVKKPYQSPEIEITEFEPAETIATGSGDNPPGADPVIY